MYSYACVHGMNIQELLSIIQISAVDNYNQFNILYIRYNAKKVNEVFAICSRNFASYETSRSYNALILRALPRLVYVKFIILRELVASRFCVLYGLHSLVVFHEACYECFANPL